MITKILRVSYHSFEAQLFFMIEFFIEAQFHDYVYASQKRGDTALILEKSN
jgi:hypothetical protein